MDSSAEELSDCEAVDGGPAVGFKATGDSALLKRERQPRASMAKELVTSALGWEADDGDSEASSASIEYDQGELRALGQGHLDNEDMPCDSWPEPLDVDESGDELQAASVLAWGPKIFGE